MTLGGCFHGRIIGVGAACIESDVMLPDVVMPDVVKRPYFRLAMADAVDGWCTLDLDNVMLPSFRRALMDECLPRCLARLKYAFDDGRIWRETREQLRSTGAPRTARQQALAEANVYRRLAHWEALALHQRAIDARDWDAVEQTKAHLEIVDRAIFHNYIPHLHAATQVSASSRKGGRTSAAARQKDKTDVRGKFTKFMERHNNNRGKAVHALARDLRITRNATNKLLRRCGLGLR